MTIHMTDTEAPTVTISAVTPALALGASVGGCAIEPITLTAEQLARAPAFIAGQTFDPDTGEILTDREGTRVAKRGELPPSLLDTFHQFRGGADKHQWQIGRVVDDAIIEFAGKFTAERIIKAAEKEMELSRAQIRKCRETWAATDEGLRAEFDDALTFEHFAVLRFIGDRAKMQAYLTLCVESADLYGGRPMPAIILAKRVQKDMGLEPPEPTFGDLLERALTAVTNLRDHADTETRSVKVAAVLALLGKVN